MTWCITEKVFSQAVWGTQNKRFRKSMCLHVALALPRTHSYKAALTIYQESRFNNHV